jgi:N-methylhydantoinase A
LLDTVTERFHAEHHQRYGHNFEGQYPLEVVNLRLLGSVPSPSPRLAPSQSGPATTTGHRDAYFGPHYGMMHTAVCDRAGVPHEAIRGPMIIEEYEGTVVIPPDASVRLDSDGSLVIELDAQGDSL